MKNGFIMSIVVGGGALIVGCQFGNYREVKVTQGGGEVALEGDRQIAHQKADGYMHQRCPQGYDIIEEGEAVVGQETQSNSTTRPGSGFFGPSVNTSGSQSTTDKREWRIKYGCKGSAPTTVPAAPATSPAPTPTPSSALPTTAPRQVAEIYEIRVRL